jgi:hypothetical protein
MVVEGSLRALILFNADDPEIFPTAVARRGVTVHAGAEE